MMKVSPLKQSRIFFSNLVDMIVPLHVIWESVGFFNLQYIYMAIHGVKIRRLLPDSEMVAFFHVDIHVTFICPDI